MEGSKAHAILVGSRWRSCRQAFKGAIALAVALAIGQNNKMAALLTTLMYVLPIFTALFSATRTRIQMLEFTVTTGLIIGSAIPFAMLAFLCSHATLDPARTASQAQTYYAAMAAGNERELSPAVFYQGRAAAVAAVFLFALTWLVNVGKTLFFPLTFSFVGAAIAGGILIIEGYLFPTWAQFYSITKTLIYCVYIALAICLVTNLLIFPYNAREPFFRLSGDYLDQVSAMITQHAAFFGSTHYRLRQEKSHERSNTDGTGSEDSEKGSRGTDSKDKKTDETSDEQLLKLRSMRAGLVALSDALRAAKPFAKREIAYGHFSSKEIEELHKYCTKLIVPVMGCNLWSQIADNIQIDKRLIADGNDSTAFLESLGIHTAPSAAETASVFELMENEIAPRIQELSEFCADAVQHAKRALQIGVHQKASFWARPFIKSPRKFNDEDAEFSNDFERAITRFWNTRHCTTAASREATKTATMLIFYMESSMHSVALKLLDLTRWADDLHKSSVMQRQRLVFPGVRLYKKLWLRTKNSFSHHTGEDERRPDRLATNFPDQDDTFQDQPYLPDAVEAFSNQTKPVMLRGDSLLAKVCLYIYKLKVFVFDSEVSAFGLRAAVALTAAALPAFFPDSVSVFLRYRLIWITFTVLLGLQPVMAKSTASVVFRIVGTIVGGVVGLVSIEIGRVPAGIIPVFFLFALPQYYLAQVKPEAAFLPVLLSQITGILVAGNKIMIDKIGTAALAASGQVYLAPPALMGYRILLTIAGCVIAFWFSIFPSLPTARNIIRQSMAKSFFVCADLYMLCSLRGASERFVLPNGMEKAVSSKVMEYLALSNKSHELIGVTKFEPSFQGRFPTSEWGKMLTLVDNFVTALSVSNNLFTRIVETDTLHEVDLDKVFALQTSRENFRVATATLYALGNAVSLWQPLPPILASPMQAHLNTQKELAKIGRILEQEGSQRLESEKMTYFGAYVVANAEMSRCLEDVTQQAAVLIGQSGVKMYLESHRKVAKQE